MAKRGRPRGSVNKTKGDGPLGALSVRDLRRELGRRESELNRLRSRRKKLAENLSKLDQQISGLGGPLGVGGDGTRHRAHNDTNLVGALSKVLTGTTMSVTNVAEEVQRQGYITTSPNFRTIVNQTLINSGKFKRMGRGLYTLKG